MALLLTHCSHHFDPWGAVPDAHHDRLTGNEELPLLDVRERLGRKLADAIRLIPDSHRNENDPCCGYWP
jgi:hypothetical protein